jgi:hypothetical protein
VRREPAGKFGRTQVERRRRAVRAVRPLQRKPSPVQKALGRRAVVHIVRISADELLTPAQAAQRSGWTIRGLRKRASRGQLRRVHGASYGSPGGRAPYPSRVYYLLSEIDRLHTGDEQPAEMVDGPSRSPTLSWGEYLREEMRAVRQGTFDQRGETVTAAEARELLGVSVRTLREMSRSLIIERAPGKVVAYYRREVEVVCRLVVVEGPSGMQLARVVSSAERGEGGVT